MGNSPNLPLVSTFVFDVAVYIGVMLWTVSVRELENFG